MFLLNLNGFNSSPLPPDQGFAKRKRFFQGVEGKRLQVILSLFSLYPLLVFVFALLLCFSFVFWVNRVLCIALFNMFCLFTFQFFFILFFPYKIKKKNCKIRKIQKQYVFVYSGTCVPWMAIKKKFSKLCIFFNLDEFLYAQLSKWALWLVFVMSKIK